MKDRFYWSEPSQFWHDACIQPSWLKTDKERQRDEKQSDRERKFSPEMWPKLSFCLRTVTFDRSMQKSQGSLISPDLHPTFNPNLCQDEPNEKMLPKRSSPRAMQQIRQIMSTNYQQQQQQQSPPLKNNLPETAFWRPLPWQKCCCCPWKEASSFSKRDKKARKKRFGFNIQSQSGASKQAAGCWLLLLPKLVFRLLQAKKEEARPQAPLFQNTLCAAFRPVR